MGDARDAFDERDAGKRNRKLRFIKRGSSRQLRTANNGKEKAAVKHSDFSRLGKRMTCQGGITNEPIWPAPKTALRLLPGRFPGLGLEQVPDLGEQFLGGGGGGSGFFHRLGDRFLHRTLG